MTASSKRKELIARLVKDAQSFRMCGPSDDCEEITAVTTGYHYLLVQFKNLAGPILPSEYVDRLNGIEVEVDNIYSAYEAKANLDALLPEIEDALDRFDENQTSRSHPSGSLFVAESRLSDLRGLSADHFDFRKLARLCEELNDVYSHQCYYATAMVTRSLLDHIPPIFGLNTFRELANNYAGGGRSFKKAMEHLENASRSIADSCLHTPIRQSETLPTAQQVDCRQQLDVLLSEILRITQSQAAGSLKSALLQ